MSLALMDIDWFKSVNDRHGHQAGDEVLKRFARVAQESLRTTDLLARWGGEEFVVVVRQNDAVAFVDTDADAALLALQRLQSRLQATPFDDVAPDLRMSFSGGVTRLKQDDALDVAIERADQAMYRAKTQGRCRCVVA